MRGILTNWLIQVRTRLRLLPETLYLAVNIIDRFLSARVVSLAKLQLVGITCIFLAAKMKEIVAPSAVNFLYCADSSYTEAEILQAEKYIFKTLEWNMGYQNPIHFLRRVSKADEYNVHAPTVAKYFLEIECVEWRLIAAPPSLLAAASMWLARFMLGNEDWVCPLMVYSLRCWNDVLLYQTPNLAHYSSYAESAIIPTANLMINYVLEPVRHLSFFKKYAATKFMKSSTYVRLWAFERWPENTQVNLAEEIPSLKALIRAQREHAIAAGIDPDAIGIMEGPRRADCGTSHSFFASNCQSISTHLFICQYNPQSSSDQPSSMNVQCTLANNNALPRCMFHDLYMFLAISSMFTTVAFTPYHRLPPTEVPPVLQLFFLFIVHCYQCYRLLHSAVRFLAVSIRTLIRTSFLASFRCLHLHIFFHPAVIPLSGDPCIALLSHTITLTWATSDTKQ